MVGCLLAGLADDRHVQPPADHASDVAEWHALVGDPVIPGSCGTLLRHEPVEMIQDLLPASRDDDLMAERGKRFSPSSTDAGNEDGVSVSLMVWNVVSDIIVVNDNIL
jgi:hypothetical protein